MSEMEFNSQVAEVMGMVSSAHRNRPQTWGIIVRGDQVQQLLELEANRDVLALQVEKGRRELARVESRTRQVMSMHGRASKLSKMVGVIIRISFPVAYMIGAAEGLMDPMFATFLGGAGIFWALCHWMEV